MSTKRKNWKWSATIIAVGTLWATVLLYSNADAARLKDIASLEGVRDNQLIGYGLVVGLNGTGDSDKTQFTVQSLVSMMERLGVGVDKSKIKIDNVAAVMVTADLPAFARTGNSIDALVSSIGDAESLVGGTLLMTPLRGPDGDVYAVTQGPVIVGALSFGGRAAQVQKNHPTVGRIPGGAIIERQINVDINSKDELTYRLNRADFTTAERIVTAINTTMKKSIAKAIDGGNVRVLIPENIDSPTHFISQIESVVVTPDSVAKVVVNERTGTVVMGDTVKISTVAVSHGNLSLIISESVDYGQPPSFSFGESSPAMPTTSIGVQEEDGALIVMDMGTTISDIAKALNAIGATPRDLIAILQSIKAAGALHAELEIL